jgi:acetyl esterase/lipase
MRRALCISLILVSVVLVGASGWAGWFVFLDGKAPAGRPDLIALPDDAPPPPGGYPTENALKIAYVLGQVDILEIHGHEVPATVELRKDIEYGRVGDRSLKVDVYSPKGLDKPVPGLIFIHGGGWSGGDRSDYQVYTIAFAQKGYVAASIGYRFAPEYKFPAAVEDAKCAVRWMRENAAELHVDPDRIAVIGGSAGGYLSLMVGYTAGDQRLEGNGGHEGVSSAVQAVVDLYGPTDLDRPIAHNNKTVTNFLGKCFADDPELFRFASPINHLDANDPPTFVLQGTIDSTVPVEQSDILVEKLKELSVPHWYDRLDGWPHTMDIAKPVNDRTQLLITEFLEKHLKGPKPPEAAPAEAGK